MARTCSKDKFTTIQPQPDQVSTLLSCCYDNMPGTRKEMLSFGSQFRGMTVMVVAGRGEGQSRKLGAHTLPAEQEAGCL